MAKRSPLDELQKKQAGSLGFLLVRCGQLWSERALHEVNAEAGAPVARDATARLFPHLLAPEGVRITDLARTLGITKQSVQPLVAELAEQGVVRIEKDPDDARARRVFLTDFGIEAMLHGTGVLLRIEKELAPTLGKRETAELKALLTKLLPLLIEAAAGPVEVPESAPAPRRRR